MNHSEVYSIYLFISLTILVINDKLCTFISFLFSLIQADKKSTTSKASTMTAASSSSKIINLISKEINAQKVDEGNPMSAQLVSLYVDFKFGGKSNDNIL